MTHSLRTEFLGHVSVLPDALGTHGLHLYAGLTDLAAQKAITLEYKQQPDKEDRDYHGSSLWLSLRPMGSDRTVRICYDLFDGPDITSADALAKCDVYFKRSYSERAVLEQRQEYRGRLRPMGLNFGLIGDHDKDVRMRNSIERTLRARISRPLTEGEISFRRKTLVSSLERNWWPRSVRRWLIPRAHHFEGTPSPDMNGRILFQARVWAPEETPREPRAAQLNDDRVGLVRALKRHFPTRFVGGLVATEFARRNFPDCLTQLPSDAASYLSLIHNCQIGIMSDGIHRSIPWKCAEYLAASRCIVAQPPAYTVPTPLIQGTNILHFSTTDECLTHCDMLLSDVELSRHMQNANHMYYNAHVRPANLMRQSLTTAIQASGHS